MVRPTGFVYPAIILWAIACILLTSPTVAADEPTEEALLQAAKQLDSDSYQDRSTASQILEKSGVRSIPALKRAIAAGESEAIQRAIEILDRMRFDEKKEVASAASKALQEISDLAGPQSEKIKARIKRLVQAHHDRAIASLTAAGAKHSQQNGNQVVLKLEKNWKGKAADLRSLRHIQDLHTVELTKSGMLDEALPHLCGLDVNTLRIKTTGPGLVHLRTMPQLEYLSLKYSTLKKGSLKNLQGCKKLETLGLDDTNVQDDDLKDLASVPTVRFLYLNKTPVTNAGLTHIQQLEKPDSIWLNRTSITDAGIVHLKQLKELRKVVFTGLEMDGTGFQHLADLTELNYVSFQHVQFKKDALKHAHHLSQVELLGLDDSNVSDADIKHLATMNGLRDLWLSRTNVSDGAIEDLKKLKNVIRLHLERTKVTPEGLEQLRAALPDCSISH